MSIRTLDRMRRATPLSLLAAVALTATGCSAGAQTADEQTPEPSGPACLTVDQNLASGIGEGTEDGITLSNWAALPAATGDGAWFVAALANGPGIEDEPFVFYTAADPENYTGGGPVMSADNVTAEFVDWPLQEGAMTDDAFDEVQDCLP
ncbi:hypothetical protein [Microbacterium kunmingense]|uniref:hypothetical protein n=1 Tax=Microbacterium kunmingense TaxID=2915939 RepID=UPI003D728510